MRNIYTVLIAAVCIAAVVDGYIFGPGLQPGLPVQGRAFPGMNTGPMNLCTPQKCIVTCREYNPQVVGAKCTPSNTCACEWLGPPTQGICSQYKCDISCQNGAGGRRFLHSKCGVNGSCRCFYQQECNEEQCAAHCKKTSNNRRFQSLCEEGVRCRCRFYLP
ncbi:unnamed protein product [Ixodes persulcatus]